MLKPSDVPLTPLTDDTLSCVAAEGVRDVKTFPALSTCWVFALMGWREERLG
jgi:hypothetical protein